MCSLRTGGFSAGTLRRSQPCGQREDGIHCRGDGTSKRLGAGGLGGAAGRIQDRGKLLWLEGGVREDIPHRVTEITRGRSERAKSERSSDLFSVQQDSGLRERFGKESDGS